MFCHIVRFASSILICYLIPKLFGLFVRTQYAEHVCGGDIAFKVHGLGQGIISWLWE